jgi:hypothetical protein
MVNEKLCTVCGYEMEEGPRDYNICPSCGTEFGLHDANSTIEELRKVWLATGPRWYSSAVPEPQNWKPIMQLAVLLFAQADIKPISSSYYGLGFTVAGRQDVGASEGLDFSGKPLEPLSA